MRTYQNELKAKIYGAFTTHRRVLAQLPTGGGKTHIMSSITDDAIRARRAVMILAHRIELVYQIAEKLSHHFNRIDVVNAGKTPSLHADIYIGMVQTMARRHVPRVNLVMIDESHHATAMQYTTITNALPHAKILGVTATPQRLDGRGLGESFDALVTGATMEELIALGYLVPSTIYSIDLPDDNLQTLRTTAGDYNQRDTAAYMHQSILYGDLVDTYKTYADNTKAIVFASSVELSKQYAGEYNAAGIPAAHIDGDTHEDTRKKIVEQFKRGDIKILSNCSLITEGFDVPDCSTIQMVRPTKSLALFLQMAGRGMRVAENKTHLTILDHVNNVRAHGFPEDEREWSLLGNRRRPKSDVLIQDIAIEGIDRQGRAEALHDRTHQLVRLSREDFTALTTNVDKELLKLCTIVERNNYTNDKGKLNYFWAYKRWCERLERAPTNIELKWFARKAGYHHNWVQHQLPPTITKTQ